eukprot:14082612-Ditylum_brightwellii.AAC.1
MAKIATIFPSQDFPPFHKCKLQRLGVLYKYAAKALGGAIQTYQESAWERYTNTPRKRLGALYKYIMKVLGSAIQIRQESARECYTNMPPSLIRIQSAHNEESANGAIQIKPSQCLSV